MKNPKLAHSINSINDESSIVSLKEDNIDDYINSDWDIVYDAIPSTKVLYANANYAVALISMNSFSHVSKIENVVKYFQGKTVIVPVRYLEFHPLSNEYLSLS